MDRGAHLYVADPENGRILLKLLLKAHGSYVAAFDRADTNTTTTTTTTASGMDGWRGGGRGPRPGMRRTRASSRCGWLAVEGEHLYVPDGPSLNQSVAT